MRRLGFLVGCLLLATGWTAVVTADPPRPGTTDSGLTESEEATLWSRQASEEYVTTTAYREAYGENRTMTHHVANGTDLTFHEPPSTAMRWTRFAHREFEPGDSSESVYQPNATLADSGFIEDAHATVFAVSPATTAHVEPSTHRFYVPTDGRVLGVVDYRIDRPAGDHVGRRTVSWELTDHQISEVRLYADDEQIAEVEGSHWPALRYALTDDQTDVESFRIEADINATLEKEIVTRHVVNGTNGTLETVIDVDTEMYSDSVTVSDEINVSIYDLRATAHFTEYPNGETGVSISQTAPWQGYSLNADGSMSVRGIWRFFTARNPRWDELVREDDDGRERVDSIVLPVYVHAYPSKLGPQAKPEYAGPTIIETWGQERETPASSLPENVTVDVVQSAYEPTYGMAVRSRHVDPEALTIHGIVYGTEATIIEAIRGPRQVRESTLSATIVGRNETGVRVLLDLRDAESGDPIVLKDEDRIRPIANLSRGGYIELAGERVKSNATGEAVVFIPEPGSYTARYHPESWLTAYPAYASDSTVVRWHPLTTVAGWFDLLLRFGLAMLPFGVALYAGRKLGSLFHWRQL